MPIFQDDLDHGHGHDPDDQPGHPEPEPISIHAPPTTLRRLSEESLRTELCEGPVPDSPQPQRTPGQKSDESTTSSREELIEKLKRGESPTWIPNRHLESIFRNGSPEDQRPKPSRTPSASSSLLPPAQITPDKNDDPEHIDPEHMDPRLRDGLDIKRPRSALHTGDFTHDNADQRRRDGKNDRRPIEAPGRPENPWIATSPPRDFTPFQFDDRRSGLTGHANGPRSFGTSPLSLSSSLSSSFAYQPPTSPLVQSESNEELGFSGPLDNFDFTSNPRRHTPYSSHSSPHDSPSNFNRTPFPPRHSLHRREGSFPSQAHQPRRSLTNTPGFLQSGTSPQTPAMLRSRRPSFSSDTSPIQQHASMVGSYEESILRGRMSTTPSKPLDFLAQIGVLGMGKCKSSLKCPPHVTLPFPAVYYSYSSTPHGRSRTDDGPSPYVGQVDLENGLPSQADDSRSRRKAHSRYADRQSAGGDADAIMASQALERDARRASRAQRRSGSPRAPPGGSYRIPEKGQIQIIIKNQNKTAVKLFLVPYDLAGMEPGTKTFIRQRCYSAGPIIEGMATTPGVDPAERPTLRYLVHLHICSPSKGRFYLYKSIRVVFANRVPDGKEKLRNETTWPEPRFTPYKPTRVMHPPLSSSTGPGATLAADKAFRRRSSGISFAPSAQAFDMMDGMHFAGRHSSSAAPPSGFDDGNIQPVDPIPLRLPPRNRVSSGVSDTTTTTVAELRSPGSSQESRPSTKDSSAAGSFDTTRYAKLNKGDLGYGGNPFNSVHPGTPGAEGLLSQRLRSLGVKTPNVEQPPEDE